MRHAWAFLGGVSLVLAAAGCAATSAPRGPKKPPPSGVVPTQIVTSIGPFDDTDANGYPDSATVSVYIFSDAYPEASIMLPATLTFRLRGKSGTVLREWDFSSEQTAGLVRRAPAGPCYVVRLSLLDTEAGDEVPESRADLSVTYRTLTGTTLVSVPEPVRVGRAGRSP
ncbi:MAG: hypothetical protein HBSAPP03_21930 [Phycisphaerae bacterium]|nr:MAG: hypothetical protein HBSAPP03_21930 [Phycisphaerae bacterium]